MRYVAELLTLVLLVAGENSSKACSPGFPGCGEPLAPSAHINSSSPFFSQPDVNASKPCTPGHPGCERSGTARPEAQSPSREVSLTREGGSEPCTPSHPGCEGARAPSTSSVLLMEEPWAASAVVGRSQAKASRGLFRNHCGPGWIRPTPPLHRAADAAGEGQARYAQLAEGHA